MAVAGLAVAAQQHFIGRVEEQDVRAIAVSLELVERGARLGEQRAAPRVDDERNARVPAFAADLERRLHQRGREVVERVVVEVLEDLHRL